jgi:hypothetical protein
MAAQKEKLLTLEQAVNFVNNQYDVENVIMVKKKTLYNKIWEGKLINYGSRRKALVSEAQILSLYGRKSA